MTSVPVRIVDFNDQQVLEAALAENIHRADLNPIEKAQGFKDYLDKFGLTQEQLGAKLGLDRTTVSNLLGLLHLPAEVQDELARVLLQLAGKDQPVIQLNAADEASLEESLAQADRGEFASDEQVRAIWAKYNL